MESEGSGQPCEEQGLPYNRSGGDSRAELVALHQLVTGGLHSWIWAPEYCPLSWSQAGLLASLEAAYCLAASGSSNDDWSHEAGQIHFG